MGASSAIRRRIAFLATAMLTAAATFLAGIGLAALAQAAISPPQPRTDQIVTADALPTVQIDGIAWSQAIVDNTVYAGGSFTRARPAGAPAGVNETTRNNLLSYNLTTGTLNTAFAPSLNAQVRAVAASPDGSRIYVGGDFSQANGQTRTRIAAYSTTNGQLVGTFEPPGMSGQIRSIVVTDAAVYVGGSFTSVGNQTRRNLAAFSPSNGQLLDWAPQAERPVWAITASEDGQYVFAGGEFGAVNGAVADGLAKIDAQTGVLMPFSTPISRGGLEAAITSLIVDDDALYGTQYHFGGGSMKSEGTFKISAGTGALEWVNDCHGDTYSVWPGAHAVYFVGHPHYCGNTSLGLPQYSSWKFQHSMAVTKEATGENLADVHNYRNWAGAPSPSTIHWLPTMSLGSVSGAYQAGWHVTGTDDYVVIGGEFPRVNGTGQQGLVRFGVKPIAPENRGPRFLDYSLIPTLEPVAPGSVKVSWMAGYDDDDQDLTYQVVRTPGGVVATFDASSNWWHVPGLSHVDTGLVPGQTYTYQIRVTDGSGNRVFGASRQVVVPPEVTRGAYGTAVLEDDPELYWPLHEAPGAPRIADDAGGYYGVPGSGVTYGVPGAIDGDTAVSVAGTTSGRIYARGSSVSPMEFSAEAWFRTTATSGRLLGFGDLQVGNSGRRDRQIYMTNSGRMHFGVLSDGPKVVAGPAAYNDGQWHHVVATLSGTTARLYVDGALVGQRDDITNPDEYIGHWRAGGDRQTGWPNAGNANWNGGIDEVAVYHRALSAADIQRHYALGTGGTVNEPPVAAFKAVVDHLSVAFDASGSADPDGSISEYAWEFGDGSTGTGVRPSHVYEVAGSYEVRLTVTDDDGATHEVTESVTVSGNVAPEASFEVVTSSLQAGFDASGSGDEDGTIASYSWDFGDGSAGSGVTVSHTYAEAGTYEVALTVTDDDGSTDTATREVVVSAPAANQAPEAAFTADVEALLVSLDATGSTDPDGEVVSYAWDFGDGASSTDAVTTHTYAEAGTYEVALTVTDDDGATGTATQSVRVSAPPQNQAPQAAMRVSVENLTVSVDGSESVDTDGEVAQYAWTFGDGSTGSGAQATHGYATAGTYTITLTVTDDDGATDVVQEEVEVTAPPVNQPPEAVFSWSAAGLTLSTDGSESTDADGTVVDYTWDFGDGSTGTGAAAAHTYAEAGDYEVTLTVSDDDGAKDSVTQQVTVQAPPPANEAPTAAFTHEVSGLTLSVDGSGSSDPDGQIVSYLWEFGDGNSLDGQSASHSYAEAGTYEVSLTVVDDDGASSTQTVSVSVEDLPGGQTFATDTFSRDVTGGFGSAELGGPWSTSNTASLFSVAGGTGTITMPRPGTGPSIFLNGVSATDVDATIDLGLNKAPTGGGVYNSLIVRRSGNSDYRLLARSLPDYVQLSLVRVVNNQEVLLTSQIVPIPHRSQDVLRLRITAEGSGTTQLAGKAWVVGTTEPATWQVQTTDSTQAVQGPGGVGLKSYLSGSATNAPLTTSWDNLHVGSTGGGGAQ